MSTYDHPDIHIHARVWPILEKGDTAWFSSNALTQYELNYSLLCCAYRELNVELFESIIQAGAHNLAQACSHALSYENYSTAHFLIEYWQEKRINNTDINVNVPADAYENTAKYHRHQVEFDLFRHVTPDFFMIVERGRNIELFEMIVATLPNHTQKMRYRDKSYEDMDSWTYERLYNYTLNSFLNALWYPMEKDKVGDYQRAIEALAQKQFPLTENNIAKLGACNMSHLFNNRLNRQFEKESDDSNQTECAIAIGKKDTMAARLVLQGSGRIDTISMCASLYYDMAEYFVIPESVTDYMIDAFRGVSKRVMPEEEEFTFFQTLYQSNSGNHQKLFWFFNRYYALDKMLFYKKMTHQFIDGENTNHQQDEEQKTVRKIKI